MCDLTGLARAKMGSRHDNESDPRAVEQRLEAHGRQLERAQQLSEALQLARPQPTTSAAYSDDEMQLKIQHIAALQREKATLEAACSALQQRAQGWAAEKSAMAAQIQSAIVHASELARCCAQARLAARTVADERTVQDVVTHERAARVNEHLSENLIGLTTAAAAIRLAVESERSQVLARVHEASGRAATNMVAMSKDIAAANERASHEVAAAVAARATAEEWEQKCAAIEQQRMQDFALTAANADKQAAAAVVAAAQAQHHTQALLEQERAARAHDA
eukprot:COSAG05_NODE_5412_length_1182_cov_1.560480_1_plen_278_part_10